MALQHDLVMRIIEKLYHSFKAILGERGNDTADRIERIEAIIGEVLHTRQDRITLLSPQALERLDDSVAFRVGLMYALHARLHPTLATSQRSLNIALAGLRRRDITALEDPEEQSRIRGMLEELLFESNISPHLGDEARAMIHGVLFTSYAASHDLTSAEDNLFAAFDAGAGDTLKARAIAWYKDLLEQDDDWLEAQCLPRFEIEDALEELDQM